jgi:hypothetical protein
MLKFNVITYYCPFFDIAAAALAAAFSFSLATTFSYIP